MKQQQPLPIYLDPVIRGDFQQLEPLTELRALTSMQLPPRTMSFIMKGVKQSPHTARLTHTHTHTSEVRRSQGDKWQISVGRRGTLAHSFFFFFFPPQVTLSSQRSLLLLFYSVVFYHGVYKLYKLFFSPPHTPPLNNIQAHTKNAQASVWFTLGSAVTSSSEPLQDLIFPGTTGSCVLGFSDSVHLLASMWSVCIQWRRKWERCVTFLRTGDHFREENLRRMPCRAIAFTSNSLTAKPAVGF